FPVALHALAPAGFPAFADDDWQAFNLAPGAAIDLLDAWQQWLAALPLHDRRHWQRRLAGERLETLELAAFFARHPLLAPPLVLAPVTAHYSWSKGAKLLGLGRNQLRLLPERGMRLDADAPAIELDAGARR